MEEIRVIQRAAEGCNESLLKLREDYAGIYFKIKGSYDSYFRKNFYDYESLISSPEMLIHKSAKSYDPKKGAFSTWLTINVRGHFLDMLKNKKNFNLGDLSKVYGKRVTYQEEQYEQDEYFFDEVKKCLDPKLYQIISYRYEYGYTPREIVKKIGCCYETFRHNHNKALNILRDSLSHNVTISV